MKPIRPCIKVYSSLVIGIVIILGVDCSLVQGGVVEREKNIKELREDINLLNLINGLNLTQHQIRHILQYTEEVKSLKGSYFKSGSTTEEMEKTFTELKTVLEKNQGIPYDIERRTNNVNERGKEETERFARDLKSIEKKLDVILLDSQKVVIEDFNPCLIPPKNLKDPVRVGQADDHNHGEGMLERLRKLPDTAFEMKKEELLEKHTYNDDMAKLHKMCQWIKINLGADVPLHFARFVPEYKLQNLPPTPIQTLEEARNIGQEEGLRFVYLSNVAPHEGNNTYCPNCKKDVVKRIGFKVLENNLEDGRCRYCKRSIPGVWT